MRKRGGQFAINLTSLMLWANGSRTCEIRCGKRTCVAGNTVFVGPDVDCLEDHEVYAVIVHELAHWKLGHGLKTVAIVGWTALVVLILAVLGSWIGAVVASVLGLAWLAAYSRYREYEADAWAAQKAGTVAQDLATAILKLEAAHGRRAWGLHPSASRRVARIRKSC